MTTTESTTTPARAPGTVPALVRQHIPLARSILSGAMDAVEQALVSTGAGQIADVWCDTDADEEWRGPHVETLCREIADEIKRRCADIVPNKEVSVER